MKFFYKIIIVLFTSVFTNANAQSVAGTISGAQTYCDTLNSGFLTLNGYTGTIVTWLVSTNNGATWTSNGNTFANQSYYHLKQSTCYKAVVKNGTFPNDTSVMACMNIFLPTNGGTITASASYCSFSTAQTLTLTGSVGSVLNWEYSTNGGTNWTTVANTSTLYPYSSLTQTTLFRANVQNSANCPQQVSNTATIAISPNTVSGALNIIPTNTVCYGINNTTVKLNGSVGSITSWLVSDDGGASWSNSPITSNSLVVTNLTEDISYKVIVKSGVCPADTTNAQTIYVLPQTTVNAGPDIAVSQGQSVQLNGLGVGTPLWLPANSGLSSNTVLNPTASPATNTNYILTIKDANNCVFSDTVLVVVLSENFTGGIITNLFSPNGDGINDFWYVENLQFYTTNEVTVYNIYGQVVFTKKGYTNDWDGTYNGAPLPDGTYYYIIKPTETGTILKGSLDILRGK